MMKKNNFSIILTATVFLMPTMVFATETDIKDATDKALVMQSSKDPGTAKSQGADPMALSKDESFVNEAELSPVATVLDVEKKENAAPVLKAEAVQAREIASKASSGVPSQKKAGEVKAGAKTSSTLNQTELRQRWKALFSKDIAPDSMVYTVKPGDSLYVLARRNHTTVDFIKKINDLKSDNIYPNMKLKIHTAPFSIKINKSKNVLTLYSMDEAVKKYSVATGKKNSTPVGEFKIKDKLVHPTWFKTGAILPPESPENALGTRWMGFDKPAYGIHGTIEPKSIGTQASEGCIRMLNEDVEELYSLVPVGTKVTVQD